MRSVFPELDKAAHVRWALDYAKQADEAMRKWHAAIAAGDKKYGDAGKPFVFISGGFREHWPEPVKDRIRHLAWAKQELRDAAEAHWKAAGKRSAPPWRA